MNKKQSISLMLSLCWLSWGGFSQISMAQIRENNQSPVNNKVGVNWMLPNSMSSIHRATVIIGLTQQQMSKAKSQLVILEEDNTPYLGSELVGRSVWKVEVPRMKLKLPSSSVSSNVFLEKTFDVYIDAENGLLVRIESRWPEGVPRVITEPDAETATNRLMGSGGEKYHSLPSVNPKISFVQAVDTIQRTVGGVVKAKQVIGRYVIWSQGLSSHIQIHSGLKSKGSRSRPRPVWAISLLGIRPIKPPVGWPTDAQYGFRWIVDAETGELLTGGNAPWNK